MDTSGFLIAFLISLVVLLSHLVILYGLPNDTNDLAIGLTTVWVVMSAISTFLFWLLSLFSVLE